MRKFNRSARAMAAGAITLSAGLAGFAGVAAAAPTNAPNAISGSFDCGTSGAGTFVVNSGNAQAATTWNVAHLTFADGSTAVFQPRAMDLTFTFDGQTFTEIASKNGPGSTVCSISADEQGAMLSGTVTGKITST